MAERFGFCGDCKNKGMCRECYRGSHYEKSNPVLSAIKLNVKQLHVKR